MLRILPLITLLTISTPVFAELINVAVAVSLKEAMGEIGYSYEAQSGDKIQFTFGSSGQLMAQIINGAPVDLYISAANKHVDQLAQLGLVDMATRSVVAGNALVLIAPAGAESSPRSFEDLADPRHKRIAIGEPRTVPAGHYAMQVLTKLKLTDALASRTVYGSNVRQVLDYVERGEVAAGIVYATDALESGDKVRVIASADPTWHEPVQYPAVIVKFSRKQAAVKPFQDYLSSPKAKSILIARGFIVESPPSTKASTE